MRRLPRPGALPLWIVAAAIAAALTGYWLWPHESQRDKVGSYITQVNDRGRTFATEYRGVESAYRTFSTAPGKQSKQVRQLQAAARRLAQLRAQLAAVVAPAPARELRKRLLAFYDGQVRVANEVVALMTYFPQLVAAEKGLRPAAARMQKDVGGAKTAEAQAAGLGAYADAIQRTVRKVDGLKVPPLLADAKAEERKRLVGIMRSIRGVRSALIAEDRPALQKAVKRLAASSNASAAASRAAIVAYNRDVKRIQKLGVRVETERRRLDRRL